MLQQWRPNKYLHSRIFITDILAMLKGPNQFWGSIVLGTVQSEEEAVTTPRDIDGLLACRSPCPIQPSSVVSESCYPLTGQWTITCLSRVSILTLIDTLAGRHSTEATDWMCMQLNSLLPLEVVLPKTGGDTPVGSWGESCTIATCFRFHGCPWGTFHKREIWIHTKYYFILILWCRCLWLPAAMY